MVHSCLQELSATGVDKWVDSLDVASVRRWSEPRSADGLSANIPMDSNLSPPGNNPHWQKIECAVTGHA